jgi:hypothetical protein
MRRRKMRLDATVASFRQLIPRVVVSWWLIPGNTPSVQPLFYVHVQTTGVATNPPE